MIRKYLPSKDFESACRIWQECGWISSDQKNELKAFLRGRSAWVQDMDGSAECIVTAATGSVWYDGLSVPASFITSVNTSHIARKRRLAGKLTAHAIKQTVKNGAHLCTLGMFEQGYYDQLGFGTGSYEHFISFSPSHLMVSGHVKTPVRLNEKHASLIHKNRVSRLKHHGTCVLNPLSATRADLLFGKNGFGLGYFDDTADELTHHIWFTTNNPEFGPYRVLWMAYRNPQQFMELLGIIKSLEDQVHLVEMIEPRWIQFQDLLSKPLTFQRMTRHSKFEQRFQAIAFWQMRICMLDQCISKVRSYHPDVTFNLKLTDPIEKYLENPKDWRGISGDYIITLGKTSGVEKGAHSKLPTLTASVNAFTRLWMGVGTTKGLAVTEKLSAPDELLRQLEEIFRYPAPSPDWEY